MADSRNQPELKTLDYEPDVEWMNAPLGPYPASSPPETLGQNSHDIRPEMRVNKVKDAGQTLACPLKQPLKPDQQPICGDKCLEPNPNQQLITEIEGLISQVSQKIYALSYDKIHQDRMIKSQAIDKIDLTLRELKQVFIGVKQ